jgi:hypothetical protein
MAKPKVKRTIDGLPVFDSPMDLILKVTKADVAKAVKGSCEKCAAAIALCRQRGVKAARVYLSRTLVQRARQWDRYVTPDALRTEIICYDRAGIFALGDYKLMRPKRSQQLGYKDGQKRSPHKTTGKPPRVMHIVEGVRPSAPRGGYGHGIDE